MGADVELFGKDLPVPRRLIEHIDEVGIFKYILHFPACQQILDILRDACGDAAPFAEPLPYLHAPTRQLPLQEQMELIHIVAGGPAQPPVYRDTVPHLILDDQHTELLQLLAQLLDIVACGVSL